MPAGSEIAAFKSFSWILSVVKSSQFLTLVSNNGHKINPKREKFTYFFLAHIIGGEDPNPVIFYQTDPTPNYLFI